MPYHPSSPRELTSLALALAGGSLCTAVYLTVNSGHGLFIYRIALLLLFFAISTISGLLFTAKASLWGDLKGLSLAVGGRFPENALQADESLAGIVQQDWRVRGRRVD